MDVSFIIPCHNLEPYIKPLLISIHMLNLENITTEFIFVLDDCTDNTEQIIQQYMDDLNYRIIKCNVHSCGLARNYGLYEATGEFIWFLDGDDWLIYPNSLKECIDFLKKNNLDIVQISYVSNYYKIKCNDMVWQYIFRYSLIKDIRFKKIQPREDKLFMQEVLKKLQSPEIYFYDKPTYYYNYCRPNSNTTQYNSTGKIEP